MMKIAVMMGIVLAICAVSIAVYILPANTPQTVQINLVFGIDDASRIIPHIYSGSPLFDDNRRSIGIITSIYTMSYIDSNDLNQTYWRMNATLTAIKNKDSLIVNNKKIFYGTRIRMFTSDTEFTAQFLDF